MADLRPQYDEEVVAHGHPTKTDVTNRAWNVQHAEDGTHKVLPGASGIRMWFCQNTAPTGWTIYATPSDELLAVKGGAEAYNANGGTGQGTWTQPNHAFTQPTAHGITQPTFSYPNHVHEFATSGTTNIYTSERHTIGLDGGYIKSFHGAGGAAFDVVLDNTKTDGGGNCTRVQDVALSNNHAGGGVNAHDNTWRPKARLGIICTKD